MNATKEQISLTGISLSRHVLAALFVSLSCSVLALDVSEEANRKGKIEAFVTGSYLFGDTTSVKPPPGQSSFSEKVEYGSFATGGIGVGYHFTDHFQVSLALSMGQCDTEVETHDFRDSSNRINRQKSQDCFTMGSDLMVDYHIFKSRLTPLVEGGIGFRGVWDVDRTREPARDPRNDRDNRHDNNRDNDGETNQVDSFFSVAGGVGVRWDITDHWFAKLVYKAGYYVPMNDDIKDGLFVHGPALTVGFRF